MNSLRIVLLAALSAASAAQAGSSDVLPPSLFNAPNCNTSIAVSDFRRKADPVIQGDGSIGWARVIGYWVDPSRDLVIQVVQNEGNRLSPGKASVAFFSLCNGRQLAFGSRPVSVCEKDIKSLVVPMRLRDAKLSEPDFEAQLTAVHGKGRKKEVEVVLRRSPSDSSNSGQVLDYFRVKEL